MPEPFISTQDLADKMGRADVIEDDGALAAVDAACDICRTLSGQEINAATSSIRLDGNGGDALVLPQFPVSAAGTVAIGGTASKGTFSAGTTVTNYALNGQGVLLRTAGAVAEADVAPLTWPKGRQNVAVTYEHGYADEKIPRDIRYVALEIAARLVVQGEAISESVGTLRVTYAVAATDLTNGERAILAKYRRMR